MIQRHCKSFIIIDNELYKRSVSGVFQRCISPEECRFSTTSMLGTVATTLVPAP
jgi:hypothetical protein